MAVQTTSQPLVEDLVPQVVTALRAGQLYSWSHPLAVRSLNMLAETVRAALVDRASLTIGVIEGEVVVCSVPLSTTNEAVEDFASLLRSLDVELIRIDRGVEADELRAFVQALVDRAAARRPGRRDSDARRTGDDLPLVSLPHIRTDRVRAERDEKAETPETMRRLYTEAAATAERLWEGAKAEGQPDVPVAREMVQGLATAVTKNQTALLSLTAMKEYDDYTFTHMVNVSILTMAQARSLGVTGQRLDDFGLAGLMHDIGKVRTPLEILNKPSKLTDEEYAVMKRHTVDGAEMLRGAPEMPILAPIVALEHHRRLDGRGYPEGISRGSLNVATMLCGISDVYDAMRAQRRYQGAFPTDRILQVLKKDDGAHFDAHLVRRFVQILGIYPPGTLVRLTTGDVAIVIRINASDPYRPRVRVLLDADGQAAPSSLLLDLWNVKDDEGDALRIIAPVDPDEHGIDPLSYL